MNLLIPQNFYNQYVADFNNPNKIDLLKLSWNDAQGDSLWTYLNLAYLTSLGIRQGFTPMGERKKIDLCWFNKPPWVQNQTNIQCELAVEEEWAAKTADPDLIKLIAIDAHLKVFFTALEYGKWQDRQFHLTINKILSSSSSIPGDYLLINISPYSSNKPPYHSKKPWSGLQVDGTVVENNGKWTNLPSTQFQSAYTNL